MITNTNTPIETSVNSTTNIQTADTNTPKTSVLNINTKTTKTNNPIVKSRKKTSLEEFASRKRMRREILAGFKIWLRDDRFFFDDEWERKFQEYCNRKI